MLLARSSASRLVAREVGHDSASSCPTNAEYLLRGNEFVLLEGRGHNVKGVNLGRSLDKPCQRLQHLRIGIGVVVVRIFLAFPQTNHG